MLQNEWETLTQVAQRTRTRAEEVIERIRELFRSGQAQMRLVESNGVKRSEWRKKP